MERIKELYLGVFLCIFIAVPCMFLGSYFPIIGAPIFSIIFGMVIRNALKNKEDFQVGIKFTSKKILQLAVILLGFGLNLNQIAKVGVKSLPIILSTITTSLIVAFIVYKALKLPKNMAALIGVGSSICGGSAIAATASVIEAKEKEIAQAISVIFLFNFIAALTFPLLGQTLGLSNEGFSIFAGSAVNDTSSVTATASAWDGIYKSANTLESATIVKLTRTLGIIPITIFISMYTYKVNKLKDIENLNNKENNSFVKIKKIFPTFIIYFLFASVITTIVTYFGVSETIFLPMKKLSKFLIVMAMGAIGLNTDIVDLIKTGGKSILLGLSCWISIIIVCLFMQNLLGLW